MGMPSFNRNSIVILSIGLLSVFVYLALSAKASKDSGLLVKVEELLVLEKTKNGGVVELTDNAQKREPASVKDENIKFFSVDDIERNIAGILDEITSALSRWHDLRPEAEACRLEIEKTQELELNPIASVDRILPKLEKCEQLIDRISGAIRKLFDSEGLMFPKLSKPVLKLDLLFCAKEQANIKNKYSFDYFYCGRSTLIAFDHNPFKKDWYFLSFENLCKSGVAEACRMAGSLAAHDTAVSQDRASELFHQGCLLGESISCTEYVLSGGVSANSEEGIALLKGACQSSAGNQACQELLKREETYQFSYSITYRRCERGLLMKCDDLLKLAHPNEEEQSNIYHILCSAGRSKDCEKLYDITIKQSGVSGAKIRLDNICFRYFSLIPKDMKPNTSYYEGGIRFTLEEAVQYENICNSI